MRSHPVPTMTYPMTDRLIKAAKAVIAEYRHPDGPYDRVMKDLLADLEAALEEATEPRPHIWATDDKRSYDYCRICLLVRQANGSTDTKRCKGPARVELRA